MTTVTIETGQYPNRKQQEIELAPGLMLGFFRARSRYSDRGYDTTTARVVKVTPSGKQFVVEGVGRFNINRYGRANEMGLGSYETGWMLTTLEQLEEMRGAQAEAGARRALAVRVGALVATLGKSAETLAKRDLDDEEMGQALAAIEALRVGFKSIRKEGV